MSTLFVGTDVFLSAKILAKKVKINAGKVPEVLHLQPYNRTDVLTISGKTPFNFLYYFNSMWIPFYCEGNRETKKFITYFNKLYKSAIIDNIGIRKHPSFYVVLDNYSEREIIGQREISIRDMDENTRLEFRILYEVVP